MEIVCVTTNFISKHITHFLHDIFQLSISHQSQNSIQTQLIIKPYIWHILWFTMVQSQFSSKLSHTAFMPLQRFEPCLSLLIIGFKSFPQPYLAFTTLTHRLSILVLDSQATFIIKESFITCLA